MHPNPALEVTNLVCTYTAGSGMLARGRRHMVIDHVSFSIGGGECLGLLGDSGSGKSTIARCVAGLAEPESGSIAILGRNVFPCTENRRHSLGAVQMLYQDHAASLDPVLTIRESLCEGLDCVRNTHRRNKDHSAALKELVAQVGLTCEMLERYPGSLSGGERQRVALARSLSADPAVLVLDEPTSALDASTQGQILDLIASIQKKRNTAVLFISHDVDAVARLCSHIAVLHRGRIVDHDTAATVLSSPHHPYTQRIVALHRRHSSVS
jgi:peptide/nickel transport system ATP-binding protein